MRHRLAAVVCLALAVFACGDSVDPGNPKLITGVYDVMIAANGKTDTDTMYVNLGSGDTVLLDFVFGISQVRCVVQSTTNLSIVSQPVHVEHSTGVFDGNVAGKGTITTDGKVNLELDVSYGGATGGDAGSGSKTTLTITGTKN